MRESKANEAPAFGMTNKNKVRTPKIKAPKVIPRTPCPAVPPILAVTKPTDPQAMAGIKAIKIPIFNFLSFYNTEYFNALVKSVL
jgi:hypothetical protein